VTAASAALLTYSAQVMILVAVAALAAYLPASVAVVALLVLVGSVLSRGPSWGRPAAIAR